MYAFRKTLRSIGATVLGLALLITLTACDSTSSGSSEDARTPVSLSFTTAPPATAAAAPLAAKRTVTDARGASLTFDRVQIVLEEIEFERLGDDACGRSDEDDCESVERGPVLVDLPLDGPGVRTAFETTIPVGTWEEVEFEVEPLDEDDALSTGTVPEGASIRVDGSFTPAGGTAQSFTWTTDLDSEQEIEFEPPLEVTADRPANVTFRIGVDSWFRAADGTLIDPATAGDDGPNEERVEDNVEASIEGYQDDDLDGDDDEDEDDDDDEDENDD